MNLFFFMFEILHIILPSELTSLPYWALIKYGTKRFTMTCSGKPWHTNSFKSHTEMLTVVGGFNLLCLHWIALLIREIVVMMSIQLSYHDTLTISPLTRKYLFGTSKILQTHKSLSFHVSERLEDTIQTCNSSITIFLKHWIYE